MGRGDEAASFHGRPSAARRGKHSRGAQLGEQRFRPCRTSASSPARGQIGSRPRGEQGRGTCLVGVHGEEAPARWLFCGEERRSRGVAPWLPAAERAERGKKNGAAVKWSSRSWHRSLAWRKEPRGRREAGHGRRSCCSYGKGQREEDDRLDQHVG